MRPPPNWLADLRGALAGLDPTFARLDLRPLGAGLDYWAFALGESLVVRCPQRNEGAANIEVEQRMLPLIAARLDRRLAIPVPVTMGPNPFGPGRLAVTVRVPGEIVDTGRWRSAGLLDDPRIAEDVGALIEAIAAVPVELAAQFGVRTLGRWSDDEGLRAGLVEHVVPRLDSSIAAALLVAWDRFIDERRHLVDEECLVHADISLDHLLVHTDDRPRLAGLIDFADLQIRDGDYELTGPYAEGGADFVRRIQASRGRTLSGQQLSKLVFYQLAGAVGDVLWALEYGQDELLAESVVFVDELIRRLPGRSAPAGADP